VLILRRHLGCSSACQIEWLVLRNSSGNTATRVFQDTLTHTWCPRRVAELITAGIMRMHVSFSCQRRVWNCVKQWTSLAGTQCAC